MRSLQVASTLMLTLLALLGATAAPARAQTPAPAALPQGPAAVAHWIVDDVWNKGDFTFVDRMLAPGAQLHYAGHTFALTPQFVVATVTRWRTAFPDFHFVLADMLIQGDEVALRLPFTGTQRGAFWGSAPTGKPISVSETVIIRLSGNQIAEIWEDYDEYGMRRQLGIVKPQE